MSWPQDRPSLSYRMRNRRGGRINWAPVLIVPAFIIAFLLVAFYSWKTQAAWERTCTAQGGTVNSHTDWVTTYDREGGSHQNSNTTYYCIKDGRTISIR